MKKTKVIYITILSMMFSFTALQASELSEAKVPIVENGLQELTIEDAITQAQKRNKALRMQKTNIEIAKVNKEAAKEYYDNAWDYGFEQASAKYSQATATQEYEIKNEGIIAEQVAYDIENKFDEILELEEKYQLVCRNLEIQKKKVDHAIKREQLGLGSKVNTKGEQTKLEVQAKEIESLLQAIDTGYRKLNDAIGGKEERYELIKANVYEPLDMKRSLQGQISYSINSDLGLWLQEEIAKTENLALTGPGPDGGAPTYTLYQQRKLGYEKALNDVSLSKEGKEEQIKQIYENILALEIQHDKTLIDIEEAQRQYEILHKRYELGMVTAMSLQELELAILQSQVQLSTTIRQHNQLKILFEKSYLGASRTK